MTLQHKGGRQRAPEGTGPGRRNDRGCGSIADTDLLRHGGLGRLFEGTRAPSTLGTFLRTFTFGHVRQRDAVAARLLSWARQALLLPGAEQPEQAGQ